MRIQVKDFMSSPVLNTVATDTVENVRSLMKRNNFHSSPVVEISKQLPTNAVRIQGIVTGTDINDSIDGNKLISEVMTDRVHVIHKDSSAKSAAKMMLKHEVHHLVVMDEGKIVGMISSLDFVKLVSEHALE